jgi:hypothetical protein
MKLKTIKPTTQKTLAFGLTLALTILLGAVAAQAQGTSVFTTGLNRPAKMITAGQASLMVAEAGTNAASNTGRISLVNRTSGARRTLIDGLPSGVNNLGGAPSVSGPSGLKLIDQTLYLAIGVGNSVMNVGPGLELPNPNSSSQIFDSVMALTLPADYETLVSGFTLSAANQSTLAAGGQVVLTNAEGKQITIRMVINLPDFRAEPRPDAPNNVRASNLYGIEASGDSLYVVDAGFNHLYRVNIAGGTQTIFTTFAPKPNPTMTGPPMVEAVPDNIRLVGGNLLVPYLTGFPFVQGLAEVRSVNLQSAAQSTFISNLTSAIDVLPMDGTGASDSYLALEFSANQLAQAPGRLKLFTSRTESPRILAADLITPTSLARDSSTGSIFVTEISPGRIIRVSAPRAIYRDYFGTGKSDFVRNSVVNNNIVWSVLRNPPGEPAQIRRVVFGLPTDTIIYGDFDGDLKQDIAVYREGTAANPQSYFYFMPSTSPNTFVGQPWGTTGDKPVTGDFDGDGKTDFCVARRVNNQIAWIILPSGGGAVRYVPFGLATDRENPSAADFNGDGRDDLIVTRTEPNSDLTHYIGDASSGASVLSVQWGNNSFAPTTVFFHDYTGDSRADIAVNYGACNANPTCDTAGTWWILQTGTANYTVTKFGIPFNAQTMTGDRPTFGDWDGDGKIDISVVRPSNTTLYALTSSNGQLFSQFWNGDSATP